MYPECLCLVSPVKVMSAPPFSGDMENYHWQGDMITSQYGLFANFHLLQYMGKDHRRADIAIKTLSCAKALTKSPESLTNTATTNM